jgi:hypothetical protein
MVTQNAVDSYPSSGTAVWALSAEGSVYRRYGITNTNFIGDYWKKIPGSVTSVTGKCFVEHRNCLKVDGTSQNAFSNYERKTNAMLVYRVCQVCPGT